MTCDAHALSTSPRADLALADHNGRFGCRNPGKRAGVQHVSLARPLRDTSVIMRRCSRCRSDVAGCGSAPASARPARATGGGGSRPRWGGIADVFVALAQNFSTKGGSIDE